MWTRTDLKQKAKRVLSGNYWKAFLVSLIIVITGGSHNGGAGSSVGGAEGAGNGTIFESDIGIIVGVVILLVIVLRILIGYVLEVGGRKFFIKSSDQYADLGYLGYGFREGRYFDIFLTMLLRSIYTILWTLLLIIPGIIKFYAYRMVPYILADNPRIGHNRAIALSNKMTKGEKWDIFVLDLSFIGWYILGALALGFGVIFVQPYYDATNAQLYLRLRKKVLDSGIASDDELNIQK
jgi:uncharacterized membrane protein